MHIHLSLFSVLAILAIALLNPWAASADTLIVGYPTANQQALYPVFDCSQNPGCSPGFTGIETAAQFTLAGSFNVSSIDVTLFTFHPGTYDFSLQDALTSPSTVFFSGTVGATSNGSVETDALSINALLGPGTYYLVASTTDKNSSGGWAVSNGTQVSNGGTGPNGAWTSTNSGTTWTFLHDAVGGSCSTDLLCNAPTYGVFGTAVKAVPEPFSLLLLTLGLTGVLIRQRR